MIARWQLDLLFAGWSIVYKGRTLKSQWKSHLQRTRQFLLETLYGGKDLHVLGAGRLLDFPLTEILKRYKKVHLYDADRGAIKNFGKLSKGEPKIVAYEVEISGGLETFSSILKRQNQLEGIFSKEDFSWLNYSPRFLKLSSDCHLVSLNLLSQLPLAYRQIFERWVVRKFGRKFLMENEAAWLKEYNFLSQRIIQGHLDMLDNSGAKRILLVSDTEQLFYPFGISTLPSPLVSPFEWEINVELPEPLEITSSISDMGLGERTLTNYRIADRKYWSWHLLPAKKRQDGIVCKVEALCLEARL